MAVIFMLLIFVVAMSNTPFTETEYLLLKLVLLAIFLSASLTGAAVGGMLYTDIPWFRFLTTLTHRLVLVLAKVTRELRSFF